MVANPQSRQRVQQLLPITGETPKQYCSRLRLERAALRLVLYSSSILETALRCGFKSHETFTRAFRRRFGVTPREFRSGQRSQLSDASVAEKLESVDSNISETRVEELADVHVAFIRHVGPYESVDPKLWTQLRSWARGQGLGGPEILMGIAQDAPGITASDKLRFDAAIRVPEPLQPTREIGFQVIRGGPFGVTTHVGPYRALADVYRLAFERLARLRRYHTVGLPAVEIYHSTPISLDYALSHTDVCLPLALA